MFVRSVFLEEDGVPALAGSHRPRTHASNSDRVSYSRDPN
jgi:hypothetical protein